MSNLAWGGFSNGRIPLGQLMAVPNFSPLGGQHSSTGVQSNMMRADAARQLSGLMQAFYKEFKVVLSLSEGFRSYDSQGWYYNRYMKKLPGWTLAAFPGTSIHGWGLSADLNVNGSNPSGKFLSWLRANAAKWGFVNDVASETWHWSYRTDLVRQTITVSKLITNPQTGEVEGPTSVEGDEGVDRLIRNKKTGSIDWINTATGFWWHTPNGDYVNAIKAFIGRGVEDLEDNWWGFYRNICDSQRDRIANRAAEIVWGTKISGFNGVQTASARLAGVDQKADTLQASARKTLVSEIVKALPASSGGSATVDTKALSLAIVTSITAPVAKSIAADLAARLAA